MKTRVALVALLLCGIALACVLPLRGGSHWAYDDPAPAPRPMTKGPIL